MLQAKGEKEWNTLELTELKDDSTNHASFEIHDKASHVDFLTHPTNNASP